MTSIQPPIVIAISAMSREQLACQTASCYGHVVQRKIRLLVPLWLLHHIDEEQIVNSVIESLTEYAWSKRNSAGMASDQGRSLCLRVTKNKVLDSIRYLRRKKRSIHSVLNEVKLSELVDSKIEMPDDAHARHEMVDHILAASDARGAEIVKLRIEGHENNEIAEILRLSIRTIERSLIFNRKIFAHLLADFSGQNKHSNSQQPTAKKQKTKNNVPTGKKVMRTESSCGLIVRNNQKRQSKKQQENH